MTTRRFKILVVDDEPVNIQVVSSALESIYDIVTALSGYEAIDQLKEELPDLILLDIMLPDIDGFDVCKIIKSDASFVDIPIIFLTALASHECLFKGLDYGGIDYLTKPVDFVLLKLRVRNHLESKERHDLVKEQRDVIALQKEQLEIMLARVKQLSNVDNLTGLANRRYFDETLESEIKRASRDLTPLSILLCDLDYFKSYNDRWGHLAGDACLKFVAEILKDSFLRVGDLVARYGGEEFIIVLPNTDSSSATLLAENFRNKVETAKMPEVFCDTSVHLTVSIGIITASNAKNVSAADLIESSDRAMYESKHAGRNQVTSWVIA